MRYIKLSFGNGNGNVGTFYAFVGICLQSRDAHFLAGLLDLKFFYFGIKRRAVYLKDLCGLGFIAAGFDHGLFNHLLLDLSRGFFLHLPKRSAFLIVSYWRLRLYGCLRRMSAII